MRLSTAPQRDEAGAIAVIHAALDSGVTLLDTADSYCHSEADTGHNERLVARALHGWSGDASRITVATKGGIRRPKGAWVNDGRAKHLREACDASRTALGVDVIDLYQLHAVDPAVPLETSVRALAALQSEGTVRRIGLCNVTVRQIEAAREIAEISSVQVSLSVLDDVNLRNGVAEYCRDHALRLIAYRPLGGERAKRLARDPALVRVATKHEVTPEEIALAWLASFDPDVVAIPGATRLATARSIGRALSISLDAEDRGALDERCSGRLLRVPRALRRPPSHADGDVVIVMGIPGAGKSTAARLLEARGYARLNRDALGGALGDLIPRLDASLSAGRRQIVLDNTYATRQARNEVIECAWRHGVPVRCVVVETGVGEAQINAIGRMIEVHGRLPTPQEIRERGKHDPRYLMPDALFRFERTFDPPVEEEGFVLIERRPFVREPGEGMARAIALDFDDLIAPGADGGSVVRPAEVSIVAGRREVLTKRHAEGWLLFAHAWRPEAARGAASIVDIEACFARARDLLGVDIDLACCPHAAGPPVCWCRKPIPGLLLEFARRRGVALDQWMVVGRSAADRTMADRLGARIVEPEAFFAAGSPGD